MLRNRFDCCRQHFRIEIVEQIKNDELVDFYSRSKTWMSEGRKRRKKQIYCGKAMGKAKSYLDRRCVFVCVCMTTAHSLTKYTYILNVAKTRTRELKNETFLNDYQVHGHIDLI